MLRQLRNWGPDPTDMRLFLDRGMYRYIWNFLAWENRISAGKELRKLKPEQETEYDNFINK